MSSIDPAFATVAELSAAFQRRALSPVDVEVLPDGSLLVSDDKAGAIYRVTYAKK